MVQEEASGGHRDSEQVKKTLVGIYRRPKGRKTRGPVWPQMSLGNTVADWEVLELPFVSLLFYATFCKNCINRNEKKTMSIS